MAKLLLIEDDLNLADMIAAILTRQKHRVEVATNGTDAEEKLLAFQYDLIVLDWELPGVSGIELCRKLRAAGSKAPVLMLTARATIDDKQSGFDAGVDDYITKPINLVEFEARILGLLRRSSIEQSQDLTYGEIILKASSGRCTYAGAPVSLSPKESELLELLITSAPTPLTRDAIVERLWGAGQPTAGFANCMKRLRAKLEERSQRELIETLPGPSYKLK